MKKMILIAMLALLSAGTTQADYYINYVCYWGVYGPDGTTPLLPNVGDKATVQLLYAGQNGVADELVGGQLHLNNMVPGDDVLLYSTTFENTGGLYEEYAAGGYNINARAFEGAAYLGAPVYGRIFDSETPGYGSNYYIGPIQNFADRNPSQLPPPPPKKYDLAWGDPAVAKASGELVLAAGTVVPEPSTIGLMGAAGIGLFLARRKSRR